MPLNVVEIDCSPEPIEDEDGNVVVPPAVAVLREMTPEEEAARLAEIAEAVPEPDPVDRVAELEAELAAERASKTKLLDVLLAKGHIDARDVGDIGTAVAADAVEP